MSVYSGFVTRQQETLYDKLTCKLIVSFGENILKTAMGGRQNLSEFRANERWEMV